MRKSSFKVEEINQNVAIHPTTEDGGLSCQFFVKIIKIGNKKNFFILLKF